MEEKSLEALVNIIAIELRHIKDELGYIANQLVDIHYTLKGE